MHRVITRAKVMSMFFSEMFCRYSYRDLRTLALSVQKIKIEKSYYPGEINVNVFFFLKCFAVTVMEIWGR